LTTFTSWTLFALFRPEDGLARFTLDEGDRLDDDRFPFILVLTGNIFFSLFEVGGSTSHFTPTHAWSPGYLCRLTRRI